MGEMKNKNYAHEKHNLVRPYKCWLCGCRTKTETSMRTHIMRRHPGAEVGNWLTKSAQQNDYLDYGGGGDPWHNENAGTHKRYGG